MMSDATTELQGITENLIRDSGAEELIPCIDAGILTLSDAGLNDGHDTDEIVGAWIELLRRRFYDGSTRLLFDNGAGELVSTMLRDGLIETNDLGIKHAGEAAAGSGLVARLPAFPQAPMNELLDLRADLRGPLVRYRAAVIRVAMDLPKLVGPEIEAHVDDLWLKEVAPAMQEIEAALADHGLVREIAKSAAKDIRTLLIEGAGLFVGMSALSGLGTWVNATIAGAAPMLHAGTTGVLSAYEGQRDAARHELFYLYEANRRLGSS
jgi:hypothetical protein